MFPVSSSVENLQEHAYMTVQLPLVLHEVFHGNLFVSIKVNIPRHDVCFHGHNRKLAELICGEDDKLLTFEPKSHGFETFQLLQIQIGKLFPFKGAILSYPLLV